VDGTETTLAIIIRPSRDIYTRTKERYKSSPVQKMKTGSAYEAICINLEVPQDSTTEVIDMIDSAKYQDYGISWDRLLLI
jgi:hypothetical protein